MYGRAYFLQMYFVAGLHCFDSKWPTVQCCHAIPVSHSHKYYSKIVLLQFQNEIKALLICLWNFVIADPQFNGVWEVSRVLQWFCYGPSLK